MKKQRDTVKRTLDIAGASIGIVLLSPLMLIVAGTIWLILGHPVLISHRRPGLGTKLFNLYKFRTMTEERDTRGKLLPDEHRLTKLGRFLRLLSLDELPQIWNVLKGDMSLVGPRPLLPEYLPRYNAFQRRRHEVKPGITGWAQVNGRNAIGWDKKFALDVWYVDHYSLWLDIKILARTIWKVLTREDVNQPGEATVEYFKGNSKGVSA